MTQPQPNPYYPSATTPSHSHGTYAAAIVVSCVISLLVGGAFGYYIGINSPSTQRTSTTPSVQLIWLTGHANISPNSGTSLWIFFDNQDTGTLTSAVFSGNTYQLWIVVGKTHTVKLYWYGSYSGTQSCSARPGIYTPETTSVSQDFLC